ncbi:MAG: hypothetical protein A2Y12_09375 [Planctomycetes bacterium GWF2_42_9]|nr:MAG: hypothetical protein A2Y12_09375 [Planctomycetes bacterium GWF2_42_9]
MLKRVSIFLSVILVIIFSAVLGYQFAKKQINRESDGDLKGIVRHVVNTQRELNLKKHKFEVYFALLKQPKETPEEIVKSINAGYTDGALGVQLDWYPPLGDTEFVNEKILEEITRQGDASNETEGLWAKTNWYIHHGNADVTNAVVKDYLQKCKVSFGNLANCVTIDCNGPMLGILNACYGANKQIGPVLHSIFHQYTTGEMNAGEVYLLLKLLDAPSFQECFTDDSVKMDVLSCLKVYTKFNQYPAIRASIRDLLDDYKGNYHTTDHLDKVFNLAESQGVDTAFNYYLSDFKSRTAP